MKLKSLIAKTVLGLVVLASVAVPSFASVVGGAKSGNYRLRAGYQDTFYVNLYRGEYTSVTVEGDGDTDLDLYIYDERGQLVSKDDDYTDYCLSEFYVPRTVGVYTARYKVIVVNRSARLYNDYRLYIR